MNSSDVVAEPAYPPATPEMMMQIINSIYGVQFHPLPFDNLPNFTRRAQSEMISGSKATFGVDYVDTQVTLEMLDDNYALTGTPACQLRALTGIKWTNEMLDAARQLGDPLRLTHRSRIADFSAPVLQLEEMGRRLDLHPRDHPDLPRLRVSDSDSADIWDWVLDTVLDHLRYDLNHLIRYADDHEDSSVLPGVKWGSVAATLRVAPDWGPPLYDAVRDSVLRLRDVPFGYFSDIRWNFGMRARWGRLSDWRGSGVYESIIDRTRIVNFHPAMSMWNAFIPDHTAYYTHLINRACQQFNVDPDRITTPVRDGASSYVRCSEWMESSTEFTAFDGKNWESYVPSILGPAVHPVMAGYGQEIMEPSGIALTTALNTIAIIRCLSVLYPTDRVKAAVLGDDMNVFSDGVALPTQIGNNTLLEYQPEDTKLGFILGLSFRPWPDHPTIIGFKAMTDKAKDQRRFGRSVETTMYRSASREERRRYAGLYLGWAGDIPLIDVMRRASELPGGIYSPTEMVEALAMQETQEQ